MRNLKFALRTLFKSPFVTTVAILSLALGIGANAAIFSMFDEILLRPLPVVQPERLVNLKAPAPKPGSTSCNGAGDCEYVFSYAMLRDLEQAETPLSHIAGHRGFSVNVAFEGQTLNTEGMMVSGSYFPALGLRPFRGRLLTPADDRTPGSHFVAVLGHSFWQNRLGSDPDVLNKPIVVNGQTYTIVGIAPAGFESTTTGSRPALYVPLSMRGVLEPGFTGFDNRRTYWIYAFGRLAPGGTMAQATSALNAVYARIINEVEAPLQTGLSEQTLKQFREKKLVVEEGRRGQSSVHEEARIPLTLLLATAAMVLLIACANIANLLLARGASRDMEMAVRLSLGASRTHVLVQLMTEALVLAALGGLASLLVAKWTLNGIAALLPPEAAESMVFQLNGTVILFAMALTVTTGLLFGLFPALHTTRPDLLTTIRANAGNITVSRAASRFRATLVTAQIALSMALLICAGLFLRSLTNISREDLGIQTERVIAFGLSPVRNGYDTERTRVFFTRLEEELAALPGVSAVSTGLIPVLANSNWTNDVSVQGFERTPDTDANASFNAIGSGYFATLGVPLLAGREFTNSDQFGGAEVAVVNEAFAKKFNLGRDVIGKMMSPGGDSLTVQIVGLVKDAKYSEVKGEIPALYFIPWRQMERMGEVTFYVKTAGEPTGLLREIPSVVKQLDPNLPVERLKTLPQQVKENVFMDRMISTLSGAFAALATLLAAIGLYGVIAYTVERRTREIGIRMAIGASAGEVRLMVLRQVLVMMLVGGVIGVVAALYLGKAASSLLFGLQGSDPLIISAAVAVLAVFALTAGYLPARRAARVDPVYALRHD